MWKRFIRAMEYRSYCMAIRELRGRGYYKKADEISELKSINIINRELNYESIRHFNRI
jgi:hypothetical protein